MFLMQFVNVYLFNVTPYFSGSSDKIGNFLINDSDLPGDNPSDKLLSALSWIARFELGKEEEEGGELNMGEYTRLPSATRQSVDRSTAIARGEDY